MIGVFFFKQKTAYEMRISDWSSDVCSSDLLREAAAVQGKSEADVAKQASNWLISDLFGALNKLGKDIEDSPVSPAQGAELLGLIADGTRSEERRVGKECVRRCSSRWVRSH